MQHIYRNAILRDDLGSLRFMISTSPLRYPGGKTRFTDFIWQSILASGEEAKVFVEPFCGGAGVAISLLESSKVQGIALNDYDPLVSCFWKLVFGKSRKDKKDVDWLIQKIRSTEITTDEWRRQKALNPNCLRTAAWKCLFLNRTSFNGILHKAGPIGGWEQKNRKLDVRFNREKLIKRIDQLYDLREQVEKVESINWKRFCSLYNRKSGAYLYLDPPYYHRAEQLYGYLFNEDEHRSMRDWLLKFKKPWMLSYDDAPEVRALYGNSNSIHGRVIDQTYSTHPVGGGSFVGRELFFSNRPLPINEPNNKRKLHVGLTVIGCFKEVESNGAGPIRMPFSQLSAVGTL